MFVIATYKGHPQGSLDYVEDEKGELLIFEDRESARYHAKNIVPKTNIDGFVIQTTDKMQKVMANNVSDLLNSF